MDTLANVPIMINDTIEYLMKSDVTVFYTDMMDKQATQFNILISVISGVFILALGATWWWNYKGAKQQIKEEVSMAKQAMYKVYRNRQRAIDDLLKLSETDYEKFKESMLQSVDTKIETKVNEEIVKETAKLKQHMDEVDKHSMQEIEALKTRTINDITEQKAELCRIFALYCDNVKSPLNAVTWWIDALKNYAIIGRENWLGRASETLVALLKNIDVTKVNIEDYESLDEDIEIIDKYLPMTRQSDKKFILKKLKEMQKTRARKE